MLVVIENKKSHVVSKKLSTTFLFLKKKPLANPFFFQTQKKKNRKKKKNLNTFEFHSHILLLTNCLNSTLPCFTPKKLFYYQI